MIERGVSRGTIDGQPARGVLTLNQKNARTEDEGSSLNEKSRSLAHYLDQTQFLCQEF